MSEVTAPAPKWWLSMLSACLFLIVSVAVAQEPTQEQAEQPTVVRERTGPERVFVDREAGVSFRFPVNVLAPPHPFARVLVMSARRDVLQAELDRSQGWPGPAVRVFSIPDPGTNEGVASEAALLTQVLGETEPPPLEPFAYGAEDPRRPHATQATRAGVEGAQLGVDKRGRILLVRHKGRSSGVLIGAAVPESAAQAIIQSFEVMVDSPNGKRTWYELQAESNHVIHGHTALPAATARRQAGADTPLTVETLRYQIIGTASPQDLLTAGRHVEQVFRSLGDLLPLSGEPTMKMPVVIYKTRAEMQSASNPMALAAVAHPGAGGRMAGFYSHMNRTVYTCTEVIPGSAGDGLLVRVGHECMHQYLMMYGRSVLPTWLNEGMAVHLEHASVTRGRLVLNPPSSRLIALRYYYLQHGGPITDFATWLGPQQLALHPQHYGEAFAMVQSLIMDAAGQARLKEWWQALRTRRESVNDLTMEFLIAPRLPAGLSREEILRRWSAEVVGRVVDRDARTRLTIQAPSGR